MLAGVSLQTPLDMLLHYVEQSYMLSHHPYRLRQSRQELPWPP